MWQRGQVVSASTAYMLTDLMEDVVTIGTGASLSRWFTGQAVVGKTGTTNDEKDLTFVGYTPYYTAGIWLGYDQPKRLTYASREHINIWGNIMSDVHADLPYKDFEETTTGYILATVCSTSGMTPTSSCTTHTDYFRPEHLTDLYCTAHSSTRICSASNKLPTSYCPSSSIVYRSGNYSAASTGYCHVHTAESSYTAPAVTAPTTVLPEVEEETWLDEVLETITPEVPVEAPANEQSSSVTYEEYDPNTLLKPGITIPALPTTSEPTSTPEPVAAPVTPVVTPEPEPIVVVPEPVVVVPEPEPFVPSADDTVDFFIPQ